MVRHLSFAWTAFPGAAARESDPDLEVTDVQVGPDGTGATDVPAGRVLAVDGARYLSRADQLVDREAGGISSPRRRPGSGLDTEYALRHVVLRAPDTEAGVVDAAETRFRSQCKFGLVEDPPPRSRAGALGEHHGGVELSAGPGGVVAEPECEPVVLVAEEPGLVFSLDEVADAVFGGGVLYLMCHPQGRAEVIGVGAELAQR